MERDGSEGGLRVKTGYPFDGPRWLLLCNSFAVEKLISGMSSMLTASGRGNLNQHRLAVSCMSTG